MADETFFPGSQVGRDCTFTDPDGDLFDPGTVQAKVERPDETVDTYVYGVDPELTKLSTGVYRLLFIANAAGHYCIRFEGLGTIQAINEDEVDVDESCIA